METILLDTDDLKSVGENSNLLSQVDDRVEITRTSKLAQAREACHSTSYTQISALRGALAAYRVGGDGDRLARAVEAFLGAATVQPGQPAEEDRP